MAQPQDASTTTPVPNQLQQDGTVEFVETEHILFIANGNGEYSQVYHPCIVPVKTEPQGTPDPQGTV